MRLADRPEAVKSVSLSPCPSAFTVGRAGGGISIQGASPASRASVCAPFMAGTVSAGCYIGKVTVLTTVNTGR